MLRPPRHFVVTKYTHDVLVELNRLWLERSRPLRKKNGIGGSSVSRCVAPGALPELRGMFQCASISQSLEVLRWKLRKTARFKTPARRAQRVLGGDAIGHCWYGRSAIPDANDGGRLVAPSYPIRAGGQDQHDIYAGRHRSCRWRRPDLVAVESTRRCGRPAACSGTPIWPVNPAAPAGAAFLPPDDDGRGDAPVSVYLRRCPEPPVMDGPGRTFSLTFGRRRIVSGCAWGGLNRPIGVEALCAMAKCNPTASNGVARSGVHLC